MAVELLLLPTHITSHTSPVKPLLKTNLRTNRELSQCSSVVVGHRDSPEVVALSKCGDFIVVPSPEIFTEFHIASNMTHPFCHPATKTLLKNNSKTPVFLSIPLLLLHP
ncbi:hypothetical protein L6452_09473 [Arctium lappa]|uniref:Uncharacterized protein n=1 Tax=Arctium lappa TaxID=4217 RepID=A0ACB9DKK5_ARCLA|nr:hypothetical protein L6452_09473 [Arctium lappa]